jgi:penicillin-binding protein 1C
VRLGLFLGSFFPTHASPPLSRPAGRKRGASLVLAGRWTDYWDPFVGFARCGFGWLMLCWFALFAASAAHAATFEEVRAGFRSSETLVLDRHGELLQRVRTDASVRRGQWVALEDVSPALRTALVLSEDKRFYEHSGVDWRAVSAAAWANLWNSRTRGASTITMQLAGLLDADWRAGPGGRSLAQKLGQTVVAQVLERGWRKDQILEAYLNLVPLRGELVGIDAVSRTLFGKSANGLDERESAITAALVRAPNARSSLVARRACEVLVQMLPAANCEGLDLLTDAALKRKAFDTSEGIAPHLARKVIAGRNLPPSVRTTLSAPLQRFVSETLRQHLSELRGRHVEDGAVVVLDNRSGEVLAWVGSSGPLSNATQVDGVNALRQPGSALKPFLYAQAIAQRRITAASLLDDSATHIATASGLYIPQNYDHRFKGWVSARTALGASLNVPAVRTLGMVSPDAFHRQLRALGLPLKESGDYYGYSLALGSAEVSLLALTNAYRTLTNGGRYGTVSWTIPTAPVDAEAPIKTSAGIFEASTVNSSRPDGKSVLDPRAAFIVADIMADPIARARTFGTDRCWPRVSGPRSKPAPARTCATTGRWVFQSATQSASGSETPVAHRCGT